MRCSPKNFSYSVWFNSFGIHFPKPTRSNHPVQSNFSNSVHFIVHSLNETDTLRVSVRSLSDNGFNLPRSHVGVPITDGDSQENRRRWRRSHCTAESTTIYLSKFLFKIRIQPKSITNRIRNP